MAVLANVQSTLDIVWTREPLSAPAKHSGYFTFDDPGVIREVLGRLGPAVHDEEVARHIAHFLRASDAMDGSELKGPSQARSPLFSSDQLGETQSYFGFKDAPALQEALRFLGPGVADATLAAYYEHFLA